MWEHCQINPKNEALCGMLPFKTLAIENMNTESKKRKDCAFFTKFLTQKLNIIYSRVPYINDILEPSIENVGQVIFLFFTN